jgi:signal transduction histidine kinase
MHVHLILQADVYSRLKGYGRLMRLLHMLRRDSRANVWDYALAAAMVAVAIVALVTRIDVEDADRYRFRSDTWWSWAATIAVCATLVGRRRWPLPTLAVGLALVLPLEVAKHRDSVAFFVLLIGLYSVAAYLPSRLAWRGVAMMVCFYATLLAVGSITLAAAPVTGNLLLATSFTLGRLIRRTRTRQERDVEAAIERRVEAVETAALAAADERARLAQELHDVVAHSLSVIAVQAGIGVHLIDRQPADAAHALDAIRTTSHAAAGELARLVDVLRDGGSTETRAAPALIDVAGVPAGVSLAAYRIVQEALTNVVRHAGRAQVTVTVLATDEHVELHIEDDGRGMTTMADRTGDGHGLIGMRERAEMYGGVVHAGPRSGGGFRVQATLRYLGEPLDNHTSVTPAITPNNPHSWVPKSLRFTTWTWDLFLAIVMVGFATLEIVAADPAATAPIYTPSHVWGWLLRISCCLTLVLRRHVPTAAFAAGWLLGIALTISDYQVGVVVFVLWIGLYTVASYATMRRLAGALIGTYVAVAIVAWSKPPDLTTAGAAWLSVLLTASAVAGFVVRRDRERRHSDLTERTSVAEAQARRARLAITTERLRIADELSTIITSSIDKIAIKAGDGSQMVDLDPGATRRALEAISMISRDSLNDLRRLLKRMRAETDPAIYSPITATLDHVPAGDSR